MPNNEQFGEESPPRCVECGSELPAGLPLGLCSRCALAGALDLTDVTEEFQGGPCDSPFTRRFGDFELIEEIARGGMGVVYKARQISLDRLVAVKLILGGQLADKGFVRRFRTEASAAAILQHPNIVAVHNVGVQDGQHYFSMDYVEGRNLEALVREQPLTARRAAQYVKTLAEAIHYAHERGILHRDLKPSNVLIDMHGEPHVTDFGLAKRLDNDPNVTTSGQVLGSPCFMPPEQASAAHGQTGRHSDVYALGGILYYLLTARPPFIGETVEGTLHQVLQNEPISPRLLKPSVPMDLETICLKCLEKETARRYATAAELAEELGRFLDDQPIRARPINSVEKLARWCRRKPQLAGAIATAVLVFAAGFMMTLWQWRRAEAETFAAKRNLYVADMNLAQQAMRQNNFGFALEKLYAHLPARGESDLRGWEWRYLWKMCQGNELFSWPGDSPVNTVAFSPGNTFVVAASREGAVRVWDFARREMVTNFLGSTYAAGRCVAAFSPDGTLLAMIKGDRLFLYSTSTWEALRDLVATKPAILSSILFTPDGSTILATSADGIKAWDIRSRSEISSPVVVPGMSRCLRISPDGRWLAVFTRDKLLVWDLPAQREVLSWPASPDQVSCVSISRAGLLVVCDRNGVARVSKLPSSEARARFVWDKEWVTGPGTLFASAFSPDGSVLATAGSDQVIRLWSTTNWQTLATFKGHANEIWSLAFSSDGTHLISGGKDGAVKGWDSAYRAPSDELPGSKFPLWFSADSHAIATFDAKRELQYWNVTDKNLERTFRPATNIVIEFQIVSPDGERLIAKTRGNIIHVVDTANGQSLGTLQVEADNLITAVPWTCSADSKWVAVYTQRRGAGAIELTTELFSLETFEPVFAFEDLTSPLTFSADARMLAGRNRAGNPVLWDIRRHRVLHAFTDFRAGEFAFSWDGRLFAAGSSDGMVKLWDIATGRWLHTLKGHQQGVGKIVFSRDNRTLFSSSTDDTVKLWNTATGQEMLSLTEYGDDTFELLLSPDDSTLAVGGNLNLGKIPVKLWQAPSLKEIDAVLRNRAATSETEVPAR